MVPSDNARNQDSAQTTLAESARGSAADLADLAQRIAAIGASDTEPAFLARYADRLSEETAEIAAMLRSLPGRPAEGISGHDAQLLAALRTAHTAGEDVAETIAAALARLAAELGGSRQVVANRPGSWEAALIAELLRGTVGPDDENLPVFGGPGGSL